MKNMPMNEWHNAREALTMPIELNYPTKANSGAPQFLREEAIWMIALRIRRAIQGDRTDPALQRDIIIDAVSSLVINGRDVTTTWEFRMPCTTDAADRSWVPAKPTRTRLASPWSRSIPTWWPIGPT